VTLASHPVNPLLVAWSVLHAPARRAAALKLAAACAEVEVWPRMPHVWQLFARVVPEAQKAVRRIGTQLMGSEEGAVVTDHNAFPGPPTTRH